MMKFCPTLGLVAVGVGLALINACGSTEPPQERGSVNLSTFAGWESRWGDPVRPNSVVEGAGSWLEQSVCGHLAEFDFSGGTYEVSDIQTACFTSEDRELPERTFVLLTETATGEELWLTSPGGNCGRYMGTMRFSATLGELVQVSHAELEWDADLSAYTAWTNQILHIHENGTYSIVGDSFELGDGIAHPRELAEFPDSRDACPVYLLERTGEPVPQHPDAPRLIDSPAGAE